MPTQEYVLIHPLRKSRKIAGRPDPIRVHGSSAHEAAEKAFNTLSHAMPTAHLDGYNKFDFRFSIVKAKHPTFDARDYTRREWIDFQGTRTKKTGGMISTSVRRYDHGNSKSFVITLPEQPSSGDSRTQSGGHDIALYPWEYYRPFYWSSDPLVQYCYDYWPLAYNYWPATIPLPGLYAYPYHTPFCYEYMPKAV